MLSLVSQEAPKPNRPLAAFLKLPYMHEAVMTQLPHGIYQGMLAQKMPFMPRIAPALFSWAYRIAFLAQSLSEYGWEMPETLNQPQITSPVIDGIQMRIVMFQGDFEGEFLCTRERGPATEQFVAANKPWDRQEVFDFGAEPQQPSELNVLLICRRESAKCFSVYVAVPITTNEKNSRMYCADMERLGSLDMSLYERPVPSDIVRPQSEVNTFILPERNILDPPHSGTKG